MTIIDALKHDLSTHYLVHEDLIFKYNAKYDMLYALIMFQGKRMEVSYQLKRTQIISDKWEVIPK